MKDPKNIVALNNIATYYITLHGLQGIILENHNPIAKYFSNILYTIQSSYGDYGRYYNSYDDYNNIQIISLDPNDNNMVFKNIPPSIFHPIIKKAYEFYKEVDKVEDNVNQMMKNQVINHLGEETMYNDFVENSIEMYKESFFNLLNNYNSSYKEFNDIKLEVLEDKMYEYVRIEDYIEAAKYRDKINNIKEKLNTE